MWFVYIVRCADDTLYTGIAKDVARRVEEHNSNNLLAASYTRGRRPVALVYEEAVETRSAAARREYEIKQMTRAGKKELIRHALPEGDLIMPAPENLDDDFPDDAPEDDEDEEAGAEGGRCPICEMLAGECDHLVASIDLTYAEFVAGAIFAHERVIRDLLERLAASDPDALKVAGAGPVLEHVAMLVRSETEEGASAGDAVAIYYPQIMAALSHILQEEEDVTATGIDAVSREDSSVENLWAQEPEWIVERLIERLQGLADEIDDEDRDEGRPRGTGLKGYS